MHYFNSTNRFRITKFICFYFVLFLFLITFVASSSNTVFLWTHVLDLCVLLGNSICSWEQREKCVFSLIFIKVYGLFALHVNVGRLFFVFFLAYRHILITFVGTFTNHSSWTHTILYTTLWLREDSTWEPRFVRFSEVSPVIVCRKWKNAK